MVVAVTGISGGIGRALRSELERGGWAVVGFSRHPGVGEYPLALESPEPAFHEVFLQARQQAGPFDAAVFLAGADILTPPLREAPYLERLQALWRVDVEGTVKCVRAIRPHLVEPARIVTTGWDQSSLGMGGEAGELYALAKNAVTAYSKSVARSWAGSVSVAVVAPGWVRTRWADRLSATGRERIAKKTLARVWQTPEEVARTIGWMLAAPPHVVTGQVIYVNRGDVMPG
ncbi:MAG: SDR family NAD(P)-dependent oxidoreductase [Thermaerobacter sp.]|nr:SDR family NAD(P)-dependent oxidoreductase [Thermaerobacter sp.]